MDALPVDPAAWTQYARPVLYALVALWGVINCLRGYRLFRTLFAVLTAFAGAGLGLEAARVLVPGEVGWAVAGLFVGLILGGVLAGLGFRLATIALGGYGAFTLAAPWVMTLEAEPLRWGVLAGAVALGGIAAAILARPVIILATAMIGGFQLVFSTAYFLGGPDWLGWIFDPEAPLVVPTGDPVLVCAAIGLGCVGAFIQNRGARKKAEGDR